MLTGGCLSDAELRQIIDSVSPQTQIADFERHIDLCDRCRQRLEELSGAIPIEFDIEYCTTSSTALSSVIEDLMALVPTSRYGLDTLAEAKDLALPYLAPSSREGSLGRIGSFEVLRILGRGGMGVVFAAADPLLNREVAIKVPAAEAVATQEVQDRFIREARAIASVKHDNIVTIYAADHVNETLYLAMELVHGESLAERLRAKGKLPWRDVLRVGQEVTAALAAAHEMGVVHRDVTPANIMLEAETGRAKVMDFGLARSTVDTSLTATGVLTGTPDYMSPEQAAEGTISAASDLFSLGTVLYHACSGISPFRSKTVLATLRRVCEETPRPLHDLDTDIPTWFSNAIQRLLEKDPSERPQSTAEAHGLFLNQERAPDDSEPFANFPSEITRASKKVIVPLAVLGCVVLALTYLSRSLNPSDGDRHPSDHHAAIASAKAEQVEPTAHRTFTDNAGFFVASDGARFAGLGDALSAAADGDSIEVRSDGPFLVDGFSLAAKRVTIRAGAGARPLFRNKDDIADRPFLSTESDLKLEGIEVRWANSDRSANSLGARAARCIVSVMNGNVELSQCRLIAEADNGCVGCERGSISLTGSHLVAPTGTSVLWVPGDDKQIIARHCVFEGERTAMVVSGRAGRRGSPCGKMTLENNSFAVGVALNLMIERPMRTFNVISRMNAFDTMALLRITSGETAPRTLFSNEVQKQIICSKLNWTESQNGYRVGCHYIKRGRPEDDRPQLIIEPSLNGWLSTFGNLDSGSLETEFLAGDISRDPGSSEPDPFSSIRIAKEMPSSQIGADLSRVGPARPTP